MSLWNTVETELSNIQAALSGVTPNVAEAQKLVSALVQKVKNRKFSAPRAFSVEELKEAVKHLAFEMQHFRCYSKLYSNEDLARFSRAARQAVMYSLLLHLRLLIAFFFSEATQDDCHVDHFNILPGFQAAFPATIHVHSS